jgi:DNA-directed RNA polymerase subunit RPC12/RpoP
MEETVKKLLQCGYCANIINIHTLVEKSEVLACPSCGGKISEATEIDNDQAKEFLHDHMERGEWDVVEVETRRGRFVIGIGPDLVRIRNVSYLFIDAPFPGPGGDATYALVRDRNYVNPA